MINVRFTSIDITSNKPCRLFRMKNDEFSNGIHLPLEANAMVIGNGEHLLFIITIDTLFINNELKRFLQAEITKYFGAVDETDIVLISSHTHYAPSLEENRIGFGNKDENYFKYLKQKLATLILNLSELKNRAVYLEESEGLTNHLTSNRRRKVRMIKNYFKSFIAMEPNPRGFKNEEFKIVKFYDKLSGVLLGVFWSFPCHPTNYFDTSKVSAEFPGAIREIIRKKEGNTNITVLYAPGFAGDVRAQPPKRASFLRRVRDIFGLSYPLDYYRFINDIEYNFWLDSLVESFLFIWDKSKKLDLKSNHLASKIIKKPLHLLGIQVQHINEVIFRKINICDKLLIFSISDEVSAEYINVLKKCVEKNLIFIATGYTDEVYGYLPTRSQIVEGGYESKEHFKPFLISGDYDLSTQNYVEKWIKELI